MAWLVSYYTVANTVLYFCGEYVINNLALFCVSELLDRGCGTWSLLSAKRKNHQEFD